MRIVTMLTLVGAIAFAGLEAADNAPPPPDTSRPKAGERRRRKRLTPEQQMQKFGGFVERAYDGKRVYFLDAQKRAGTNAVEWVAEQARIALSFPVRIERSPDGSLTAPSDAGGVVRVVDLAATPALLVAPEDGWAQVNVAVLAADSPSEEVLETRLKKELWRAFVYAFGGGNSQSAGDVMRPVHSLRDLDAVPTLVSSPEPFNAMLECAAARDIRPVFRTTYRQACREGWAPAPTNEWQKAIFEQVKSDKERGPTNPIKISPPNAKK